MPEREIILKETIKNIPVKVYYDTKNLSCVRGIPATVDITVKGPITACTVCKSVKEL